MDQMYTKVEAVDRVALIKGETDGSRLGLWEEKKIIKNESTSPHSFLLLVSLAIKYVSVYAVTRRQCRAVCTFRLSTL